MLKHIKYHAHSKNRSGEGIPETQLDHLQHVSKRAERYASAFGAGQQAFIAGVLHDLGKYADQFQRRLTDPNEKGRDHSSAGALIATKCYKHLGIVPALAIQGHHIGLQQLDQWKEFETELERAFLDPKRNTKFTDGDLTKLLNRFEQDGFAFPHIQQDADTHLIPAQDRSDIADMLDVRMLFSALVDADFIETEAHFDGDREQPRRTRADGPILDAARALEVVKKEIDSLTQDSSASSDMQQIRTNLYHQCLGAGTKHKPGLFTLSAPTGTGKTLSMLAFALQHAAEHKLRRVIVVMPFLSIIEQTATIYRRLFSEDKGFHPNFVIEDHSHVRSQDDDAKENDDADKDNINASNRMRNLLAQNWDAPIVLTTSIQCLESLMANRPAACRKLHRLAGSVILFDEVQTIPKHLAVSTLATLSRLSERFGSTIVFSTATQPAFDSLHDMVSKQARAGWKPIEIVKNAQDMFEPSANRIHVRWRHFEPLPWKSLADELVDDQAINKSQVLCIVNLKRHAQQLTQLLLDRGFDAKGHGILHLSTNMCPAHRQKLLEEVKQRFDDKLPIRLISTQCIEAGVDLDFPTVYRALGPLEAIAQAAGRCNRSGGQPQAGIVHVFSPEDDGRAKSPPGAYKSAIQVTTAFLNMFQQDEQSLDELNIINDPNKLRSYFRMLYKLTGTGDESGPLQVAIEICNFVDVAKEYRLIDQNSINIVVPYDNDKFNELVERTQQPEFHRPEAIRKWTRDARPYTVSIYRPSLDNVLWHHIQPVEWSAKRELSDREATWFTALEGGKYHEVMGWLGGDDSLVA